MTGNDKVSGQLTDKALKQLKESPTWAPNLKELAIYDQTISKTTAFKQLTRARTKLAVKEGTTVGDGYASSFIAAASGGGMTTTYFKGKMVGLDAGYGEMVGEFW